MEGEGYHVVDHLIVPDHSPIDEALLCDWSRSVRLRFPEAVVVGTEKDWARREQWLGDVAFCEMKLVVIRGQEVFDEVCHRIRHCMSARS
jgi:tetraacyldisaccharide-1-P 4'-kinase